MSGTYMLALINAFPEQEAEFNDWYTNRHLLDAIQAPGLHAARRFVLQGAAAGRAVSHKYLCVYDAVDPRGVIDNLAMRRKAGEIVGSDTYDRPGMLVHFYDVLADNPLRIDPLRQPAVYFEAFNPRNPGAAFERSYLKDYLPKICSLGGIAAGQLLVAGKDIMFNAPAYQYVALYDIAGDLAAVLKSLSDAALPAFDFEPGASRGVYRPITPRITKADALAERSAAAK